MIRRRELITLLGSAAASSIPWPLPARAQQGERVRRIGVLMPGHVNNQLEQVRIAAFVKALEPLGWIVGRNLQIETRWADEDADLLRRHVTELVAAAPDVIAIAESW